MKLMMDLTGSTLSLRAESPADLEFLYVMQGVHTPGPWAHATFTNLPYDLLGFEHLEAGKHYALRGQPPCVMAGVLLKLDWLTYAEPLSEKAKLRTETANRICNRVLEIMELAAVQSKVSGDAARVG